MFIRLSLIAVATSLSLPVFAADFKTEETCQLSGKVRLEAPTQIVCQQDMTVAEGTEIVTNGHELQIWVVGNVQFGEVDKGLVIRSFDASSAPADEVQSVLVYARSAGGFLSIDNSGLKPDDVGGDISITYGTTDNYDQKLKTGRAATAIFIRDGEQVAAH